MSLLLGSVLSNPLKTWLRILKPLRIPGWPNGLSYLSFDSLVSHRSGSVTGLSTWDVMCMWVSPSLVRWPWVVSWTAQLMLKDTFCHQGEQWEQYLSAFSAGPCLILAGGVYLDAVCGKGWAAELFWIMKGEVICFWELNEAMAPSRLELKDV